MEKRKYILNTILAAELGLILLVCVLVRTFAPLVILPEWNIPNLVLISLLALVTEAYAAPGGKRCYICIPLVSAVTFGLLSWCAAFTTPLESLKVAIAGGCVFTLVTWLYGSVQDRLSSGPTAKAAPVVSAFGLYLAAQCLTGMIL